MNMMQMVGIMVFFFFVLGVIGIFFAVQGMKAAKGTGTILFSTVKKLEKRKDLKKAKK